MECGGIIVLGRSCLNDINSLLRRSRCSVTRIENANIWTEDTSFP